MNEKKPREATPEQLMKIMDMEMAVSRSQRAGKDSRRRVLGIMAICIIMGITAVSLCLMLQYLAVIKEAPMGKKSKITFVQWLFD